MCFRTDGYFSTGGPVISLKAQTIIWPATVVSRSTIFQSKHVRQGSGRKQDGAGAAAAAAAAFLAWLFCLDEYALVGFSLSPAPTLAATAPAGGGASRFGSLSFNPFSRTVILSFSLAGYNEIRLEREEAPSQITC